MNEIDILTDDQDIAEESEIELNAARYLWLREELRNLHSAWYVYGVDDMTPEQIDTKIDRAMAGEA
ncbi:MAG: hypothetical protein NVS3B3_18670 [Aquirhabdus sp.]